MGKEETLTWCFPRKRSIGAVKWGPSKKHHLSLQSSQSKFSAYKDWWSSISPTWITQDSLPLFKKFLKSFWLGLVFVAEHRLSLVAASEGYSLLRCTGLSLRWLLLLWSTGSRHTGSVVVARGLSSCGMRALERRLSSCGARA